MSCVSLDARLLKRLECHGQCRQSLGRHRSLAGPATCVCGSKKQNPHSCTTHYYILYVYIYIYMYNIYLYIRIIYIYRQCHLLCHSSLQTSFKAWSCQDKAHQQNDSQVNMPEETTCISYHIIHFVVGMNWMLANARIASAMNG